MRIERFNFVGNTKKNSLFSIHSQVLCNTGGLHEIPVKHFPPTVEQLSLTKNNFPLIKSDAFGGLRALRKLTLDGNNITTIKPFAFRGLPRLRDLSIQNTPLTTVAPFAFAGLQNISTINLGHNKILRVEGYAFAGTANAKMIMLFNNPMIKLEPFAFSSLTNVERLVLPSGLRQIEPDSFSGLDTVGYLKLSFMDLESLQPHTFRGLRSVRVLSLQESDLGVIAEDAFNGLAYVDSLNILNNKIDAIIELNLTEFHYIKQLKIQGNHLLETPEPGSITLDGIDRIIVQNNHFPCGCHIHVLLESPLANTSSYDHHEFLSKNFCISPLELNGMHMNRIDLSSIGRCHEQVTRENLEGSSASTIALFSKNVNSNQRYWMMNYTIFLLLLNCLFNSFCCSCIFTIQRLR
jgi:leucine-rich repeat and immunoglobulin-like domain-containing nogo receptor-interacting protein